MTKTIPSDNIGKANIAYSLVALLSKNAQLKITNLLEALDQDLPRVIWPVPPEALHVTLCEIIGIADYGQDKEALYAMHHEKYEQLIKEILATTRPVMLDFNTLEASPRAIILTAEDDGTFGRLRESLAAKLPLPQKTQLPPAIIHSSIARYIKETDLEQVRRIVQGYSLSLSEEIHEFRLIKSTVFPALTYKTICSYRLI